MVTCQKFNIYIKKPKSNSDFNLQHNTIKPGLKQTNNTHHLKHHGCLRQSFQQCGPLEVTNNYKNTFNALYVCLVKGHFLHS